MVDESHEKMVEGLLKKTDDELIRWTCSGRQPEGYIAQTGRLIFEMRCASKSLKAATNMVKVTWAIALITLATQIALIVITLRH